MEKARNWAKDLIVYEIATKGFTSPEGPETGTFRSLTERLDYLKNLGINMIWLSGHQLCDSKHFYNIWTQYAVIDPSEFAPELGNEDAFREFVMEAHKRNIRVILDVITHGLMKDSPIVAKHPEWFCEGTWGMVDFDWHGGHEDLDEWWVAVWKKYVLEFGVDGYRLDVATYRPDLWKRIRKECEEKGKEIVIIPESGPAIAGVTDFLQHGDRLSIQTEGVDYRHPAFHDMAHYVEHMTRSEQNNYHAVVTYIDEKSSASHLTSGHGLYLKILGYERSECKGVLQQKCVMRIENLHFGKDIYNIQIYDKLGHCWSLLPIMTEDYCLEMDGYPPTVTVKFPIRQQSGQLLSMQLSCHDNGWMGYPWRENPYIGRGSRFTLGYAFLLAPFVPVFMSGEEWDADYVPLPALSPDLYGGNKKNGAGRWLYGSMIDWNQLNNPQKAAVLEDVRRLIQIRKEKGALIYAFSVDGDNTEIFVPGHKAAGPIPLPYAYRKEKETLIIAGNPHENQEIEIVFDDWEKGEYQVTDLFNETSLGLFDEQTLSQLRFSIPADKRKRGGILVLEVRKMERSI